MDKRKTLVNEYKQRKITGGVYRLTNLHNGKYFLEYTTDLQAIQNRFNFMVSSNSCFHHKLQKDWLAFGGRIFIFEPLETIDKKEEQSQDEFIDDLKMIKELWGEKLDPSNRY